LHHLSKSGEILAAMLLSEHNIFYYQDLMRDIRTAIEEKTFTKFAKSFFIEDQNETSEEILID
jgi:queuine tRNA-ribosyltransferase